LKDDLNNELPVLAEEKELENMVTKIQTDVGHCLFRVRLDTYFSVHGS
jgi:hypothetical protein